MANLQSDQRNPWNPLSPTARDLQRTETLARKNKIAVGLLGFLISPFASAIYLNRAANSFKIFGYTMILSILINLGVSNEEKAFRNSLWIGLTGNMVMMAEQFMTVGNARKRQPSTNT